MIRHKFGNVITEYKGVKYRSRKEARYVQKLELRKKAGEVLFWFEQVSMKLPGGTTYRLDFLEFHADDSVHFVDVKGHKTQLYLTKKREIEFHYPGVIIEEA